MPPILLHPPKRPRAPGSFYRRWNWRRQVIASGTRLFVGGFLVLLFWAGWYMANRGFGRQFRVSVVEELRKHGIDASVRRLTLDPFRGLVAQDLRIYEPNNREHPLAAISEVSLDINYAALLHRQPFLNSIDVTNADLTFPSSKADPRAPKAELKHFRAHIYFPPEQIFIRQAEGIFNGVRISATGQLLKRADYQSRGGLDEAELRARMELLQRLAQELSKCTFAGGPPSLQVKFSGDVAQMEDAHVEATLSGERIQREGYEMRALALAADWSNRTLSLKQCEWTDNAGAFSGRGSWEARTKAGEFEARSSIAAKQFLDAFGFGNLVSDLQLNSAPALEFSGKADFSAPVPRWSVLGHLQVENFSYRSIPLLGLATAFSWDGERTMLQELRLRHASGELQAELLIAPGDFRLDVQSTLNPADFRALADHDLQSFLSEWEFPRAPTARMELRGSSTQPDSWTGEGSIEVGRARFRGVWFNNASAKLHLAQGALAFRDLRVVRDEGMGTGDFVYDYTHHEVRLANIRTHLHPASAIYWIEPKLFKIVAPYKFHGTPAITAEGVVQYRGGKNTHLALTVEAPGGMDYLFLGKTLSFERVKGDLLVTDDRVQLAKMEGTLFGGTVRGAADISTAEGDPHYSAEVALEGVNFPRLTELYFKYETSQGQLAGNYRWTGLGDDARTMRGTGDIKVSNGNVFAIPVLGPISGLVAAVIPGAGYSVAKQATASFTIKEGVIHTDDFKVSGKLFGLVGHGDIHFLEDRLNMDIRIHAGGAGILLTPVYSLFEYKGEGSLAKPNWHPKNF